MVLIETLAGVATTGDGCLRLSVRVAPNAKRTELVGLAQSAEGRRSLHIRLAARPVDDAANDELLSFLCACLNVRRSEASLSKGRKSRDKTVLLTGDPDILQARLSAALGALGSFDA